ncbi:MAG: PQQ-binding-like beta-propeller repeat protein [Chloroflexi bacterium]|nr:PQQ-binding-like beta-propeller repeat protein [Chloroflexota bacterium]
MSRKLARSLQNLLTLLLLVTLIVPNGITVAQEGGDATPTETTTPADTPAPTEMATPTETVAPTETATPTEAVTETATPEATATASSASTSTTSTATHPRLSSSLRQLADAYTQGGAANASALAQSMSVALQNSDENVQVTAVLADGQTLHDARQLVAALGGLIEADTDGWLQISLPLANVYALAEGPVFSGVRLPVLAEPLAGTYSSEGVGRSNADDWHALGITGKGVKVAVIDVGFAGYTGLLNNDLPPASLIHTKSFLSNNSLGTSTHGTQVAQTLYDMAPGVEMWLVTISTDLEFAEAMDWLITQNVDVINSSIGFLNYDDGDGNDAVGGPNPLVDSVNRVDSAGILFVMGAGNQAFGHQEQAFADSFDPVLTHAHNWVPIGTPDIYNEIIGWPSSGACRTVIAALSWNDWDNASPGRDFTLSVKRFANGVWTDVGVSSNDQQNGYPWPIESVSACVPTGGKVSIVVQRVNTDAASDYLELYTNWPLEYFTSASSLVSPADADAAFTVGAFNWLNTASLSPDSSQGPVNEPGGAEPPGGNPTGAIKPDIAAPACTTTNLFNGSGGAGFCGTSAAAAHVSGAVALFIQNNPGFSPLQIRNFFENNLVDLDNDPGAPGKDSLWGAGTLFMDAINITAPLDCLPAACVPLGPWPLFQADAGRKGASASVVDANAALLWTAKLAADVRSVTVGPTDSDFPWPRGLVYVKAGRYLYALNPDSGNVAWSFDLGVAGATTGPGAPAVTDYKNNGTLGVSSDDEIYVYVGSGDGYFYRINAIDGRVDTNAACKSAKLGTNLSKASPLIGADGSVYLVDDAAIDRLISVDPVGCKQRWVVNLGPGAGTSSPVYWDGGGGTISNDRIFVGADKLYSITVWGGIDWALPLKTGAEAATVPTAPLVVNDFVYAVNSLGDLYYVPDPANAAATAIRVSDAVPGAHASGSLGAYLDTGTSEYLLFWGQGSKLYRYRSTTDTLDATNPDRTDFLDIPGASLTDSTPVTANPATDQGVVFFGASNGKVYALDADLGTMVHLSGWPRTAAGSTAGGLAIAADSNNAGWLFVPSNDDNLRLFGTLPASCFTCKSEQASAWPLFQRGTTRTGASTTLTVATPAGLWSPLWTRAPGGDVFPPVAGKIGLNDNPDGITYFVTGRYLRALDLTTRNILWSYDLGLAGTATGFAAPAVSAPDVTEPGFDEGVVYVGGKDGVLHAVRADNDPTPGGPPGGIRVWANDLGFDISKASPVIGDDGTVYVVEDGVTDRLIAVSHLGSVRWSASIGASVNTSSPVYFDGGAPGTITGDCVFVGGAKLYGFLVADPDPNNPPPLPIPCPGWTDGIAPDTGTVSGAPLLVGSNLYALNSLGDLYRVPVAGGAATRVGDAPTGTGSGSLAFDSGGCGGDGCIYWTLGGKLQRWDIGGGAVVTITGSTGLTTNSTPVVDAAGNVFFGTSDFKLWWVTRAGVTATLVYTAAGSMANAGAIINNPTAGGGDGILLWPSADDKLYAFGAVEAACGGCNLAGVQWPTFQKASNRNPGTGNPGGASMRQSRLYTAVAPIRPPVIDTTPLKDRIYFISGKTLYARSPASDTAKWSYDLGVAVTAGAYGMPAIGTTNGTNRILYLAGADGNLHALRVVQDDGTVEASGVLMWKTDVGNNISKASVAVSSGANGLIFVVEDNVSPAADNLVAVDYKGSVVWKKAIGDSTGTSSPAINGGTVVVAGGGGLYAFNIDATGNAVAGFPAAIGATNGSPVVISGSGGLDGYYVVNKSGKLWKVDTNGTTHDLGDADGAAAGGKSAAPFVLINGGSAEVFFGLGTRLYRKVTDGASLTDTDSLLLGGDLGDSSPLGGLGVGDFIYIASTDGKMYVVREDMTSVAYASGAFGGSMAGSGAFIDSDTLIWPIQSGKLLVFDGSGASGSGITIDGAWPLFQKTDLHTGSSGLPVSSLAVEQATIPGLGDVRAPVIDNAGQGYFTAGRYLNVFNVSTGLITKSYDMGATSSITGYASPAVVTSAPGIGTRVIVADNNGVVRAYDPGSSSAGPVWSVDVGLNTSKASPLIGRNSLVYVLEDGAVDRLHAISLATGGLLWSTNLGVGPGTSSPMYWDEAVDPDFIFVGSDKLYKVNANTGAIAGSSIVLTGQVASAPLRISNTIYVMTTSAKLYGFLGGATFTGVNVAAFVSNTTLTGAVGSSSLATNGANSFIYFAIGKTLYRANTSLGSLSSVTPTLSTLATNFTNSTPLVDSGGFVHIGGADGLLYRVDSALVPDPLVWNPVNFTGWPKRIGVGTTAASAAGALAMDALANLYVPSIDDNLRRFAGGAAACPDCDLYTEAPWPMFQHDAIHTGLNTLGAGHRTPIVHWTKATTTTLAPPRTPVLGPPTVIFPGGLLFYTSGQNVIARDAVNGTQAWAYNLGTLGIPLGGASPALLLVNDNNSTNCPATPGECADDTVYVIVGAKDGFLTALNAYATNPAGEVRWRVDLGLDISKSSPLIGPDGTIYIVEDAAVDRLHAVYWNGARRWVQTLGAGTGASSPVYFDTATDAVIVGSANKMYSFNAATGAQTAGWPVTIGTTGTVNTTPAVIGDDLWVLNNTGKLYNVNLLVPSPAAVLVATGVGAIGDGVAPAIQNDPFSGNDIVVFTAGTRFYRVLWTGDPGSSVTTFWTFAQTLGTSSPVIDDNGWSYVLDSGGYLRAFYRFAPPPFMVFSKKIATQGTSVGGVIIGNDGMVFAPSRNNTFYAIGSP